eukprot:TRINITY_DN8874_c0_g1_i1.p1 TRINITY_DN8874_c0_g1~~TRINITY_DN8874_c0_g1_i1.p1  ORF type:complete len:227 (+),score=33.58 TRINITY_DN8874_c0_g1_i1:183-863(+)
MCDIASRRRRRRSPSSPDQASQRSGSNNAEKDLEGEVQRLQELCQVMDDTLLRLRYRYPAAVDEGTAAETAHTLKPPVEPASASVEVQVDAAELLHQTADKARVQPLFSHHGTQPAPVSPLRRHSASPHASRRSSLLQAPSPPLSPLAGLAPAAVEQRVGFGQRERGDSPVSAVAKERYSVVDLPLQSREKSAAELLAEKYERDVHDSEERGRFLQEAINLLLHDN